MAEESDSKRRLIMMLTIILAGTAVTFIDLSPLAVIFIALGIGLVMLFALQMISFEELKETISGLKNKLNQPLSLKKDKTKKSQKNTDKAAEIKTDKIEVNKGDTKKELPFASLFRKLPFVGRNSKEEGKKDGETAKPPDKSFFSGIFGLLSKKREAETKSKKIDELLDKTLSGETPAVEKPDSDEGNEFSDFDNFDLGLEEETSEISDDQNMNGFEDEISDSTIADILAKEGIQLELDDEEFPKAPSDTGEEETQNLSDQGVGDMEELDDDVSGFDLDGDEFGDFEDIDLDELEPEDEIDLGEEDTIENVEIGESEEESAELTPVEDDDILSAPPKEWTQTKSAGISESGDNMFENPVSMSLGGDTSDDDLFDMLKSDTKKAVSVQETSLVRDLADAQINTEELVEDLEGVLEQFGVKKEQLKDKNIISDEGDINDQSQ